MRQRSGVVLISAVSIAGTVGQRSIAGRVTINTSIGNRSMSLLAAKLAKHTFHLSAQDVNWRSWGGGRYNNAKRSLITQYAGPCGIGPICATEKLRRPVPIGRKKTRGLSLMSVNSSTATTDRCGKHDLQRASLRAAARPPQGRSRGRSVAYFIALDRRGGESVCACAIEARQGRRLQRKAVIPSARAGVVL